MAFGVTAAGKYRGRFRGLDLSDQIQLLEIIQTRKSLIKVGVLDTCTCISKTHKEKNTQTNKNKTLLMYIDKTKQNKTKQKTKQN